MRPVVKPALPLGVFHADPGAVLLQVLGEYCSFSEQPLPAEHYVWDKGTSAIWPRPIAADQWDDVLLLSASCYQAQLQQRRPQELLFPDEVPLTFHLFQPGPFVYTLKAVDWLLIDEEGHIVEKDRKHIVLVEGATTPAQDTIEYLGLNTRWHKPGVIEMPLTEYGNNRFIFHRTNAWFAAEDLAKALAQHKNDAFRDVLAAQARRMIAGTGYWSTWLTVFAKFDVARDLLEQMLLPPATERDRWYLGPGGHRPFPGTNADVFA